MYGEIIEKLKLKSWKIEIEIEKLKLLWLAGFDESQPRNK